MKYNIDYEDLEDPEDFYDDEDCPCEGCGKLPSDESADFCPLCCPYGGYAPGSEDCDFCKYASECAT